MGKTKNKLKADVVVKNYWRNNEQFADFFNAVLYEGKQVIKPDELEDMDTEESYVSENKKYVESVLASRDNIKIRKKSTKHDVELCILGMESQEHIHYAMPMRVMGYDYGSYKKQYDSNAVKYKTAKGLSDDEFISKMKRTDKFIPIITIVIYYGEKAWDGAVSLQGMLDIPEDMKAFILYAVFAILTWLGYLAASFMEARKNNLKLHNINNKDLFNLFGILLNRNGNLNEIKEKAINYAAEHKVEKTVIMTVTGAVNCKIDYNMLEKEADADMCTVFEETRKEGEAKAIIELGFEFGLSEEEILDRLQKKLNISLQKAQEYFSMFAMKKVIKDEEY